MAGTVDRASALSRLAAAYAGHQVRRWTGRGSRGGAAAAERVYRPEHYLSLTPEERELMPEMSRCINCGICAMVAGRLGGVYLPDLASAYLRPLHLLPRVKADLEQGPDVQADLEAAAAACPVGVPLPAWRRWSTAWPPQVEGGSPPCRPCSAQPARGLPPCDEGRKRPPARHRRARSRAASGALRRGPLPDHGASRARPGGAPSRPEGLRPARESPPETRPQGLKRAPFGRQLEIGLVSYPHDVYSLGTPRYI